VRGHPRQKILARAFLRILIGVVVFGAGLGKVLDPLGFEDVLKTYHAFPDWAVFPIALAVINVEFGLGFWLLRGWRLKQAALASIAMHLFYTVWMVATLRRGLDIPNCGCFGVFLPRPLTWESPIEDLVFAALSALLWWLAPPIKKNPPESERSGVGGA
jgi:uncharacterized membrane protein YphA (DoxX/SURF4 family)